MDIPLLRYEDEDESGKEQVPCSSGSSQPRVSEESTREFTDGTREFFDYNLPRCRHSWQMFLMTRISYVLGYISTTPRSIPSHTFTDCGHKAISIVLPSFITTLIWPNEHVAPLKELRPTAWLDGLRGVAALFVVIYHTILHFLPNLLRASGATEQDNWIVQMPFIRIFYSGPSMVAVFFVVSGFSLSHKPLKLIRAENTSKILENLASSIFRRIIRLWLPVAIITSIEMVAVYWGFYDQAPSYRHAPKGQTFSDQFHHWVAITLAEVDPFRSTNMAELHSSIYDPNLWTIP